MHDFCPILLHEALEDFQRKPLAVYRSPLSPVAQHLCKLPIETCDLNCSANGGCIPIKISLSTSVVIYATTRKQNIEHCILL